MADTAHSIRCLALKEATITTEGLMEEVEKVKR